MNKFASFFTYIKNEFKDLDYLIVEVEPRTLNHLANLKTTSNSLIVQLKEKAIIFYVRGVECVVLGSIIGESTRKFKQLLILTYNEENGSIEDNTKNEINKIAVKDSLNGWLIKDIA